MSFIPWPVWITTLTGALIIITPVYAKAEDAPSLTSGLSLNITATRNPQRLEDTIGDVTVVRQEQLQAHTGQSVTEVLRLIPGLQWRSDGAVGKPGSLSIRGSNGNQVVVLIDGIRYGSTTAGTAALEHIPVDQIERIEVLRGAASSLFGADAIGGVVQIFTRQAAGEPQIEISMAGGNLGQQQGRISVSGQHQGTQASLTVAHQQLSGVSAIRRPDPNGFFHPDVDGYQNDSVSLHWQQAVGDQLRLGLQGLFGSSTNHFDNAYYDPVSNAGVQQGFDYQNHNRNGAASAWGQWQWTDQHQTRWQYGEGFDHSRTTGPESVSSGRTVDRSVLLTRQQQWTLSHQWQGEGQQWFGLIERVRQSVQGSEGYDPSQRHIDSALMGYGLQRRGWDVQASVRQDRNSQFGNHTTGSLGLAYEIDSGVRIGGQYATAFRAPTFNDLYVAWGGSPTLKPEQAQNLELFLQVDGAGVHSRLTGFDQRIDDLITWGGSQMTNLGEARLQGISWHTDWNSLDGWQAGMGYDVLRPRGLSGGVWRDLPLRARQTGTAHVGWQQGPWQARIEGQAVGQRYSTLANTRTVAGYGLINLSGAYRLNPQLQLHVQLNNLLDRQYEMVPYYGTLGIHGLIGLTWRDPIVKPSAGH